MRIIKLTTILLAVACMMVAFVPPAASASYDSEVATTTINGSQLVEITLNTDVFSLKCKVANFSGTQVGAEKELGTFSSKAVAVHPSFEGCNLLGVTTAFTTTGCNYEVTEATELKAPTAIVCEAGKSITIKDKAGLGCEVVIGPQSPSGQVSFTNVGTTKTRTINWQFETTGIAYSWTAGCPNSKGKAGSNTNGSVSGSASMKGTNFAKEQVGIWVTPSPPVTPASYDSEAQTTTLSGSQSVELTLTTDVGNVRCKTATLAGTQTGGKVESGVFTSASVSVRPAFSNCNLSGQAVSIETTGCNYEVAKSAELKAPTSIVCEAGKSIIIKDKAGLGCEVVVGPQTPSGQVSFSNVGSGSGRTITWHLELTGISYSWTKGCPNAKEKSGSNTNGTNTGTETLKGSDAVGEQVGIWATPSAAGNYDSEVGTTTLSGSQSVELILTTDVGNVKCKSATFASTQYGSFKATGVFSSPTVTVHPTFSSCNLSGQAVNYETNGCDYEVAKPAELKVPTTIVCEAGKSIIIKDKAGLGCEVVIGAQTPSGQVSFSNEGSGSGRTVAWKLELASMSYSWTKGCPNAKEKSGSNTNGTNTGTETIKGLNAGGGAVGIWVT
jgi:hypothetical protein